MKAIDYICKDCLLADPLLCLRRGTINRVENLRAIVSTEFTDTLDLLLAMAVCRSKTMWKTETIIALEAPSEMQRLVEWLEERAQSYIGREVGTDRHSGISVSPVRKQELEIVIDHIHKEFLGEKK